VRGRIYVVHLAYMEPSKSELKKLFSYDEKTGLLINKITRNPRSIAGTSISQNPSGAGYLRVQINGRRYQAHRLIWIYHYGKIPKLKQVDHKDRVRSNGRIGNLRLVTLIENRRNQSKLARNTSGMTGVSYSRRHKLWRARLCRTHLGWYKTFDEAAAVRQYALKVSAGFTPTHGL
jgi:hypothetical protein